MDYSSEVWGLGKFNVCDTVQNKALRYFLGVHKYAPLLGILGDIGWYTPIERRCLKMVKFWNHIVNMDISRIPQRLFNWGLNNNSGNWCKDIECIFDQLGLKHVFEDRIECDISIVKDRLNMIRQRDFSDELSHKPKLRLYCKYKNTINLENYVISGMSRSKRSLLAQFRLGILPLEVETGRFRLLKDNDTGKMRKCNFNERLCKMCSIGTVEDEMHFLCECPSYDKLRQTLFSKTNEAELVEWESEAQFVYLMQNHWFDVSNYIANAWSIRTKYLFV
jgi:hypothetical protein